MLKNLISWVKSRKKLIKILGFSVYSALLLILILVFPTHPPKIVRFIFYVFIFFSPIIYLLFSISNVIISLADIHFERQYANRQNELLKIIEELKIAKAEPNILAAIKKLEEQNSNLNIRIEKLEKDSPTRLGILAFFLSIFLGMIYAWVK